MKVEHLETVQKKIHALDYARRQLAKIRGAHHQTITTQITVAGTSADRRTAMSSVVDLSHEESRLALMLATSALENQERELVAGLKALGVEA